MLSKGDLISSIKRQNYPSPAAYRISDSKSAVNIYFSKSNNEPYKDIKATKKDKLPGPGSYKIPTSFDNINSVTRSKGVFDPTFKFV